MPRRRRGLARGTSREAEATRQERPSRRSLGAIAWVRRWGVSIASLASGLATLFVFRRGLPHAPYIVGYVVLLWLLFAILTLLRHEFEARGRRFVVTAGEYTIQSLYHGLLLFVLPAYWASTTVSSVNVVFLVVLVFLAVLATFDPWYSALVHPRPWLGLLFFVVSIFAALNVALPLVGVPPHPALLLSAWAATLALTPVVHREARRASPGRLGRVGLSRASVRSWTSALALTSMLGLGSAVVAHFVRALVPPAPLALARATIARDVADSEPVEPFPGVVSTGDLAGGLVAYTAISAPAGLRQPIAHVWWHDGTVVDVMRLSPVRGGRRAGFRTYSRKTGFPPDPTGRWAVDVMTTSGQLIGRLRFRVTP
jgi:Family of unknown function (DUF5924)/Protein of unknown function (DUF2914)